MAGRRGRSGSEEMEGWRRAVGGGVSPPASNRCTFVVGLGGRPLCHEASITGGAGGGGASAVPAPASGGLWSAGLGETARALAETAITREKGDWTHRCEIDPNRST